MQYNDNEMHQGELAFESTEAPEATELTDSTESTAAEKTKKVKAHVIRRNIEDYLAEKALKRRLTDVFEDEFDFAMD